MSFISMLKKGACVFTDHPALIGWYVQNRLCNTTLKFEQGHLAGLSLFARGVTFRITSACNLRCKMCRFVESGEVFGNPNDTLPLDLWLSIVDDLAKYRPYISITGGEPTLYPHLEEILARIRKYDMRSTLTTNGTMLVKCGEALVENAPDMMIISLDGSAEVHNEVRGQPRVFEKVAEGLSFIRELKTKRSQNYPILIINSSITAYNYKNAEMMIDIAKELGVDALNYQFQWSLTPKMVDAHNKLHGDFHPLSGEQLGAADPLSVDIDEVVAVVKRIRKRASSWEEGIVITFHPELNNDEVRRWFEDPHNWVQRKGAACAWLNTEILPNGNVEPCFGFVCGNVKEQPFSKIWNSSTYRKYRRRLANAGDFPVCVRCCSYFRRD